MFAGITVVVLVLVVNGTFAGGDVKLRATGAVEVRLLQYSAGLQRYEVANNQAGETKGLVCAWLKEGPWRTYAVDPKDSVETIADFLVDLDGNRVGVIEKEK
ncbi:MAG: hypothetical protein A3B10_01965 [Candidatus Doudnabacteria bacterium RIFCSPLOWO2_01_FULL_44_21]|uniref:Uncharacterized protein n=1 Tax=Candidatus Doudnabacteria bacterium RIFCSPLOWO2_01_FULL_44_21 TaxID=1817841 RepID=A0A1F5Q3L8_9BACT|nr:MAG: hypothetical protein A3B95_01855 [Candidatus Doudnabacteria bacterium RIFCSPHIGHO2_02_FULL_43_13b]OGE96430.1 MAG: hypothetical protein A3B10_01965 [Candidatus Doudnabacteria bacterium RIFCSPLOWO2_01_FULL_44_21]